VRQIVEAFDDIGSVERMADGGATERQIRLVLAYCERSLRRSTQRSPRTPGRLCS
jgi:hypothetical protein